MKEYVKKELFITLIITVIFSLFLGYNFRIYQVQQPLKTVIEPEVSIDSTQEQIKQEIVEITQKEELTQEDISRISILTGQLSKIEYHSPPTTIIEQGSGVETVSYIIFHDDESPKNYYAKNGNTGEVEFSGTDASTVIQSAIDVLTNGGKISIKAGTYIIDVPGWDAGGPGAIVLKSNIEIVGEGYGTVLRQVDNSPAKTRIFEMAENSVNMRIANMRLDGNRANQVDTGDMQRHGIITATDVSPSVGGSYFIIENMWIEGFTETGIDTAFGHNFVIRNVIVTNNGDGGIWLDYRFTNALVQNVIAYENQNGIVIAETDGSGGRAIISDSIIYSNVEKGILVYVAREVTVTRNIVYDNGQHGIAVDGGATGDRNIISNNIVFGNEQDGIKINNADNIIVEGNLAFDDARFKSQNYGIEEAGTSDNNYIVNNKVWGNTWGQISFVGSNTEVKGNIGYVTENSGTATVANGGYVEHNLDAEPTLVVLTPTASEARQISVTFKNSTHFRVGLWNATGSPVTTPEDIYWYAEV